MGELESDRHVKYILSIEKYKKGDFEALVMEHLRMNGAYWGLTTLDLLHKISAIDPEEVVSWVMKCYHENCGGFGGNVGHDPHLWYTLSAVQILGLFDRIDALDVEKVSNYVAGLQNEDGSFSGDMWGEIDTRFSYCAICCLSILHRLYKVNVEKAVNYIVSCKNLDGGFGCTPGGESHAAQKQVYVSFHDEEWGVPVHDDRKLFELLIFSEALAELSWPTILNKRDIFRKLFDNFDPSSVAKFSEKKIITLKSSGGLLLSEQKLRAVVVNARQMLKIMEEFGSFSHYCWSFMNHKPIINRFCYARQVPIKTPKSEAMSKDLMQRGFRCVGPTVMYSFMQAAGVVNDHLSSCFRYGECIRPHAKELKTKMEEPVEMCTVTDKACSLKT